MRRQPTPYKYASHYSYDIHGNVDVLLQQFTELPDSYKRVDYEYDLISGNVNKVYYQKGQPDQFTHKYEYDADNRITNVYTSTDDLSFKQDAKYYYYDHGPLARAEIGDKKVQGIDYAYTIQGWLKGVNSETLDPTNDPGKDAQSQTHKYIARDAFGYSLGYFNGDYKAINPNVNLNSNNFIANKQNNTNLAIDSPDLYNGNISNMVTTIINIDPLSGNYGKALPQLTAYKYDKLNRLVQMKAYNDINLSNNTWGSGSTFNETAYNNNYQQTFTYDANGNIRKVLAKDFTGLTIDDQTFGYNTQSGKLVSNKLYSINDNASATGNYDIVSGQTAFDNVNLGTNNYKYTEIGELKSDVQDEIADIKRRADGKITEIIRTNGSTKSNLKFDYDPMGKRVAKHVYTSGGVWQKTEYYVRDAQGNLLSVYSYTKDGETPQFKQTEKYIYGSSLLGIDVSQTDLLNSPNSEIKKTYLGNRNYSGSNHLGNELVTFSDKPNPVSSDNETINYYTAEVVSSKDYGPFGEYLTNRTFMPNNYPNSFNGKRDDAELNGWQDYGERFYMKYMRRINDRPDPIIVYGKKYPELSTYQFASNTPISAIDLDGLEGYQYLETIINKNGTTETKRIVAVDIYVATSKTAESNHYQSTDIPTIKTNLENEYNKGLKDASGNIVEFRFNMIEFDADKTIPIDKAKQLKIDPSNYTLSKDNIQVVKGFVMERAKFKGEGRMNISLSIVGINIKAKNSSHTQAHEVGHIFLNYDDKLNPTTKSEHQKAGGIFKCKVEDENGKVITPTEDVNQENVDLILKSVPEIKSKTTDETTTK